MKYLIVHKKSDKSIVNRYICEDFDLNFLILNSFDDTHGLAVIDNPVYKPGDYIVDENGLPILGVSEEEIAKRKFISGREDTLLMLFYLADKQLRVLQSKPPIDKETFWGQIKSVHKNQQFFDGTF